jgi:hypothetical protein
VGLAAGEVLQRRPPAGRGEHPQVGLIAVVGADGGLGGAAEEDLRHLGEGAEAGHDGLRVLRRHQQVQVAHRLPHAAEAPRRGRLDDAGEFPQGLQERAGQFPCVPQRNTPASAFQGLNPGQHLLLGADPHAGEGAQFARASRILQLRDGGDAQRLPEEGRLTGADVRHLEHLHHPVRHLRAQFLVGLQAARPHQFVYLLRQRLADAGDGVQFPGAPDFLQGPTQRGDVLRGPPVRHNPVGVLPLNVQNVRHPGENGRNLTVVHFHLPSREKPPRHKDTKVSLRFSEDDSHLSGPPPAGVQHR